MFVDGIFMRQQE